jgi:hypothetical protein
LKIFMNSAYFFNFLLKVSLAQCWTKQNFDST